jgi:transcriptional regulator with XRE-family HTH domain
MGGVTVLNPAQCRAARGLLGVTQEQLAREAGLSKRTIIEFENGSRGSLASTIEKLQRALESLGVEFIGGDGPAAGVRFRNARPE